jgi:hypothetical protein
MATEQQESWLKWVALTTTILAVCAAIGSLKGSSYSTRVQILTTQESNQWAYFQSKSIKQHLYETKRDLFDLELMKPQEAQAKEVLTAKRTQTDEAIKRYVQEQAEIKAKAEMLNKDQAGFKVHGASFGMSVMFFQIAIMLSAIGSLMKKRYSWITGLVMGAIGLLYFMNGFLTFL